ncbi:MAG: CDP-glucose 4,6-dehydratase [Candidatus Melainabacteria bacterium]|nr:CDP-glucose 4,6-dehydratase [Candidatus Melainabacteria bacterium]
MIPTLKKFFYNKKILITGHTGFKGAWLYTMLESFGAEVYGFALAPNSTEDLSSLLGIDKSEKSFIGDICDYRALENVILKIKPEIIFHLAAQSLVLTSYAQPAETFKTNVIGTLNLLEILRKNNLRPVVVNVTTDKCYANSDSGVPFQEGDSLGGNDPYSASKAMVEILSNSYYQSFFKPKEGSPEHPEHRLLKLATVRAGNVIGGGDWNDNRLVPDFVRFLSRNEDIVLRNPASTRPWQFVLEPLYAYCLLAYKLSLEDGSEYCSAWNVGPGEDSCVSVLELAHIFLSKWGSGDYKLDENSSNKAKEAKLLMLDASKAKRELGWRSVLSVEQAISMTALWYKAFLEKKSEIKDFTYSQIEDFLTLYGNHECV